MMLTPCWPSAVPTGGAGVACPARIWSFTIASTFLRGRRAPVAVMCGVSCGANGLPASRSWMWFGSDLLDLVEPELDRGLPVEDVDEDLQLALVEVDLADRAVEVGERTRDDADDVLLLELQAELRLHLFLL